MTETLAEKRARVFEVGPDRVTISEAEAVIDVKHAFQDWEVREMNHVPVYLEEKKYQLVAKRKAQPPYAVQYLLKPWPQYQATNATGFLSYDTELVAEREAALKEGHVSDIGHAFLLPIYPLLGMLWSGVQKKLTRFGFIPHALSGASIFVIFALVFGQGVFSVILLNSSLRTGKIVIGGYLRALAPGDYFEIGSVLIPIALLDGMILVAMIADTIVRYSKYLRDEGWSGGFLEWTLPRFRSKQPAISQTGESAT